MYSGGKRESADILGGGSGGKAAQRRDGIVTGNHSLSKAGLDERKNRERDFGETEISDRG